MVCSRSRPDHFEQLKALSCIMPHSLKEAEKIDRSIQHILLKLRPSLEEPFYEYVRRSVNLDRNFELFEAVGVGVYKFKEVKK